MTIEELKKKEREVDYQLHEARRERRYLYTKPQTRETLIKIEALSAKMEIYKAYIKYYAALIEQARASEEAAAALEACMKAQIEFTEIVTKIK